MNGSEVGTGKHGCCRAVAFVGRWLLVEVRLYLFVPLVNKTTRSDSFVRCLDYPTLKLI